MQGGGPGGGIHKSTDGGESWRQVTEGLPEGDIGRIGFAVWERKRGSGRNVTFPARQYSVNGERRSFELALAPSGTDFQRRVWRVLQDIPPGETRSYGDVAAALGQPSAARAVAQACARNKVALVVPCHRVVRADGSPGGYRWGVERKRQLLQQESAVNTPMHPTSESAARSFMSGVCFVACGKRNAVRKRSRLELRAVGSSS